MPEFEKDLGTIVGFFDVLHEDGNIKLKISDPLYSNHQIDCVIKKGTFEDIDFSSGIANAASITNAASIANTARKRIEIGGMVFSLKNGIPVYIVADWISLLPDDKDLPTADDVRGILKEEEL